MSRKTFYVITGGTFVDVAPHFAFCAPAFGTVGDEIADALPVALAEAHNLADVVLVRTRMAVGGGGRTMPEMALLAAAGLRDLRTNDDLATLLDHLVADESTKGIVMAAAVCDFEPAELLDASGAAHKTGKKAPRLQSKENYTLKFIATDKLLARIRATRKDIFLVAFKTTAGVEPDVTYARGLKLLKSASANLVVANDIVTHHNIVIAPERARYFEGTDRARTLLGLCQMIAHRSTLHFTRSTVVEGDSVPWDSELIPEALRAVVDHCVAAGAYKAFDGRTVGHFAVRGPAGSILTSKRDTDFNDLNRVGLVKIEAEDADTVIAHGSKPSVGGQSQRMIFGDRPELDCIVHFHSPVKTGVDISTRPQWPFECGSHECGANTSAGLRLEEGSIHAVMLDKHGPNIVFNRHEDPKRVIDFIDRHFDLARSTDGFTLGAAGVHHVYPEV